MSHVSSKNYSQWVTIQIGEEGKAERFRVDRQLKGAISRALEPKGGGGGQTSVKELSAIVKNVVDGDKYGKLEKALVRMLYQATDDRQHVYLNGKRVQITDPAEKAFVHAMAKFFGSLNKGAIKQMSGQTAVSAIQSFAQAQAAAQRPAVQAD